MLDDVARALRSGASVSQALETAATRQCAAQPLLEPVAQIVRRGGTTVQALERWRTEWPDPGVRLAVAALSLSVTAGGGPARAVEQVAATVRERLALEAEMRALAAPARTSAAVLVAAPLLFMLLAVGVDPKVGSFLFATPGGWACLAGAVTLDLGGLLWSVRLLEGVT